MSDACRVVHYVNQFFAGIGGEEAAGVGPALRDGPIGPGIRLQQLLHPRGSIVATALCGDTYFGDHPERAVVELTRLIRPLRPDLLVLGPAFNSGRYGLACARLGVELARELGVPAVTGMHEENPGVELARRVILVARTEATARGMEAALQRMASLARAALAGEVPSPGAGGYFPRGIRVNVRVERPAAERAVEMLLKKLRGEPFETELGPPVAEQVPPAPPVADPRRATIALVTDGGLVPRGNPLRMPPSLCERYCVVEVGGLERLDPTLHEVYHRGYDTSLVNEDPNRLVPLDAARQLEREGRIGRLVPRVYSTAGCSAPVANARRVGREIAEALRADGVEAAILTST